MDEELVDHSRAVTVDRQKLSAMVRARLLFKREIEIDRGHANLFNLAYFERLVSMKQAIDAEMAKTLTGSGMLAILVYLVGVGSNAKMPAWGIELSSIPGVVILLSLVCSFMLTLASVSFMNSQTYDALIDQIILDATEQGVTDVDMLKASFHKEWLIFKVLRADFSFHAPVHIRIRGFGRFLLSLLFVIIVIVMLAPFFILMIASPYLALVFLPDGLIGSVSKAFAVFCSIASFLTVFLTQINYWCDVELPVESAPDSKPGTDTPPDQ